MRPVPAAHRANNLIDRVTADITERIAEKIAEQIAAEMPRIVENVSKAAAVEAVSVARDMPQATADAILRVLTLGRLGG